MKLLITLLSLAVLACAQKQAAPLPKPKSTPSMGFVAAAGTAGVVDTDLYDAQKYIEEADADSSSARAKRDSHEAALTREFSSGFNDAKECDGIIFKGKGDQKPQFGLQIMVDSHDTPGQKPVWVWILTDAATSKFIAKGEEDSAALAARNVCLAARSVVENLLKQSPPPEAPAKQSPPPAGKNLR